MTKIELYQSVLKKLGNLPHAYLEELDSYLSKLMYKVTKQKPTSSDAILAFSGSWSDMSEEDFDDYLKELKNSRNNLFDREINL